MTTTLTRVSLALAAASIALGCSRPPGATPGVNPVASSLPPDLRQNADADPVRSFEAIVARFQEQGTAERIVPLDQPSQPAFMATNISDTWHWYKRRYQPVDVKYDVKKSDSLVSPFVATMSWHSIGREYACATKEEAERYDLSQRKAMRSQERYIATFGLQGGVWRVTDVTDLDVTGPEHSTSTSGDHNDEVWDWWYALGGQ